MNGLLNASAVVMLVTVGLTVRPNPASVAAGMACARTTLAAVGQVMALARTVQTNQLLVIREPWVTFEAPLAGVRGAAPGARLAVGANASVTAGPLEPVAMSYILRNHS